MTAEMDRNDRHVTVEEKAEKAARELYALERQTEKAHLLLARLQNALIAAGDQLGGEASLSIETNQQLVLSAIALQAHAENVERSAGLDVLTELPNRAVLLDRCAQAIEVAKRRCSCVSLLFLDVNNFKQTNDTLGHSAGDKVLQHIARCLKSVVRKADTVSRHGGDEFVILLADISQMSDAMLIAEKIHASLISPFQIGDQFLSLTVSVGIGLYPEHGEDAAAIMERADLAMYHAKRNGLGSFVYDGEIDSESNRVASNSAAAASSSTEVSPAHRRAFLREANERLIVATLHAQKLQAAAEKSQQHQQEFLAVLAHELRNPLTPIRMAAALLSHIGNDALQLQELQLLINRQVTRMSRLLDDVFDVARITSGKLTIASERVDLHVLIHEVIDTYMPLINERRQHFIVQTPGTEILMEGDPGRLTQVFSNLLDNASKYSPEGGELKLVLRVKDARAVLAFSDSGIGIMPEMLLHIFEPFVQDPTATKFNNDGLGIGLTVVRELVEAHSGVVTAASDGSGFGSEFVINLPLFHAANQSLDNVPSLP